MGSLQKFYSFLLVAVFLFVGFVGQAYAKRENPYVLNVKGLDSAAVYQIVESHLASVKRSPYIQDKSYFIDRWRDKKEKPFVHHAQATAFFSQNLPYWLKTLNNAPGKYHYVFTTDRSGWNGFSAVEAKRTKLEPLENVESLKLELYDSRSMGFHREFWLGLAPYAGPVWSIPRVIDRWAYQSTNREENQAFMQQLQSDLQAKLDEAKHAKP